MSPHSSFSLRLSSKARHVKFQLKDKVKIGCTNPQTSFVFIRKLLRSKVCILGHFLIHILRGSPLSCRSIILTVSCKRVVCFYYDSWYAFLIWPWNVSWTDTSAMDMSVRLFIAFTKWSSTQSSILYNSDVHPEETFSRPHYLTHIFSI